MAGSQAKLVIGTGTASENLSRVEAMGIKSDRVDLHSVRFYDNLKQLEPACRQAG